MDGRIVFDDVPEGEYILQDVTSAEGWQTISGIHVSVTTGKNNVIVRKLKLADSVTLTLETVDNDDKTLAIGNIGLNLYDDTHTLVKSVTTNSEGKVRIPDLKEGAYSVIQTSTVEGYVLDETPYDFELKIPDDKEYTSYAITVKIAIRKKSGEDEVVKKGTANITMKSKKDGTAIPGVVFGLYDKTDDSKLDTYTTDADGKVSITDLEQGSYYFKIISIPEEYNFDDDTIFDFEITKTNILFNLNLTVDLKDQITDGTLSITVSDQTSGDAIPGVKLKAVSGSDEYEGTTDGNGTVKFEHIPFGTYDVYETEVPDGYALSTLKTNVSITKEKPLYTLNLQKMKLADILGTLNVQFLDADSKAGIRNAKFALYREDKTFVGYLTTDKDGNATMADLPQGSYYLTEDTMPSGYSISDKQYPFTLQGNVLTMNLKIEKQKSQAVANSGYLKVLVTDQEDTSKPVVGATLSLLKAEDQSIFGTYKTNSSGEFEVKNIPLGTYYVSESTMPYGYTISKNKTEIKFTMGNPKVSLTFRKLYKEPSSDGDNTGGGTGGNTGNETTTTGAIYVTVVDKDSSKAIPGAVIGFYKKDGTLLAKKITDSNGKASMDKLTLEEYYFLEESMPDGYTASTTKHYTNLQKFNIYNIRLEKPYTGSGSGSESGEDKNQTGTIKVILRDSKTNALISGVTLELLKENGDSVAQFTTDATGTISFAKLPFGKYSVVEKKVPDGYTLSTDKREVELSVSEYSLTIKKAPKNNGNSGSGQDETKKTGSITFTMLDQETKKPISGATMALYKGNGTFVKNYVTDAEGKIAVTGLDLTEYYFVEKTVPEAYTLSDKQYKIPLSEEIRTYTFTLTKLKKQNGSQTTTTNTTGKLIVNLKDQNEKAVTGAVLAVYKKDGTFVKNLSINALGVSTTLSFGDYYIMEKSMPSGYTVSTQKFSFSLSKTCTEMTVNIKETKKNTSSGSSSGSSSGGGGGSSSRKVTTTSGSSTGGPSAGSRVLVSDGTWKKDNTGRWWYQYGSGSAASKKTTYPKDTWEYIESNNHRIWYYFDSEGYMKTGWLYYGGSWYFLNADGAMITNSWHYDGTNWYHMGANGKMDTGWIYDNGRWYYLNPVSDGTRGAMKTGWQFINEKWYYLNPVSNGTKGALYVNTVTPDGYRVNANGEWVK